MNVNLLAMLEAIKPIADLYECNGGFQRFVFERSEGRGLEMTVHEFAALIESCRDEYNRDPDIRQGRYAKYDPITGERV